MRYASIDILRMIALIIMVFVHFAENLAGVAMPFAGFGAPLFAFLSGVSYALWSEGQLGKGKSEEELTKVSVRRGLFVFGVGFAFNILVWLPEDVFNWDVLTFIGAALLLLNLLRNVPLAVIVVMAIAAVGMAPLLQHLADYDSYWLNRYFDPDMTLSDVIIGFLATGYFPLFPWLAYSLIGYVIGRTFYEQPAANGIHDEEDDDAERPPSVWIMVGTGAALFLLARLTLLIGSQFTEPMAVKLIGKWTMFPPTLPYVVGTLGLAMLLAGLLLQWIDRGTLFSADSTSAPGRFFAGLMSLAKTFSRYAFSIYVLHHIVHLWPLWIYGTLTTGEPTYYWTKAMPLAPALGLGLLFLMGCYGVFRWLGPDRTYGIEAAMRWLCD